MTILFLQALLATVTQALPRLFLLGTPLLLIAIVLAAYFDVRTPWNTEQPAPIRRSPRK